MAGTLTGLQADNRCKVLGALSIVKLLKLELALMKAVKEGSELYLFIEMKCTLAMFLTYAIGWSLKEIVEIENTRISNKNDLHRGSDSDHELRQAAKFDIKIKSDWLLVSLIIQEGCLP